MRIETRKMLAAAYLLQAGGAVLAVGSLLLEVVVWFGASPKDLLSWDSLGVSLFLLPFLMICLATRLLCAHRTAVITLLVASIVLFGLACFLVFGVLTPSGHPEGSGIFAALLLVLQLAVVALFVVVALVAVWVGRMRNRPQKD